MHDDQELNIDELSAVNRRRDVFDQRFAAASETFARGPDHSVDSRRVEVTKTRGADRRNAIRPAAGEPAAIIQSRFAGQTARRS